MTTGLEAVLLDDVKKRLDRWQRQYRDDPARERSHILLLALEREQIVAVAYREEAVAGRLADLDVDPATRALIRQTLVWIWKDEQLHAEYLRGELLATGGPLSNVVVYGRQIQGAISGWTSATASHRDPHRTPIRSGAAGVLVMVGALTGQVPPILRQELHFQTFRHYCDVNVALEASAELAYRRLVEVAVHDLERRTMERLRDDEARHVHAFRLLAGSLTEEGALAAGRTREALLADLAEVSPWFIPAAQRATGSKRRRRRSFGSGSPVVVRSARHDGERSATLTECLNRAGLGEMASAASTAAVRVSFMLGYDRRDHANVCSPELIEDLARYLAAHGVSDVAVLEAPTVYERAFAYRSVPEVARYFGFDSPAYRIVDISADLRAFVFERGFVQRALSATWADADLRIVVPKLRTDPIEFAHLGLSTLEGSTGPIDATFYAGRQVDFRSATMMLLDVAPPDFAVVDGWAPVADGPFGVMGCSRPADVRHIYAGADVLTVDQAVLADLGVSDPRRAPIMRQAYHWFGLGPARLAVDGERPDLAHELRGAHASAPLRVLGTLAYPIYVYGSDNGERFVPAMDTVAFPPRSTPGPVDRLVRWGAQRAFGIHAPGR